MLKLVLKKHEICSVSAIRKKYCFSGKYVKFSILQCLKKEIMKLNMKQPNCSFSIVTILLPLILFVSCAVQRHADQSEKGMNVNFIDAKQMFIPNIGNPQGSTYIVNSTVDLNGKTVIIPEGYKLKFERGKIINGRIIFQNTKLEGDVDIQCDFDGTVSNDTIYVDWFIKGQKSPKKLNDVSKPVQSIFGLGAKKIIFGRGYFQFANIMIGPECEIEGKETIIIPMTLSQNQYHFNFLKNVFYANDAKKILVKNITFQGSVTGTVLKNFKSDKIFGEPIIWVNKADKVLVDGCVFRDIENCTYSNKAYTYYGKKQGSCVCLWDVSDATYINCEQVGCRHDEQIWIIAVHKPIMDTKVTYRNNYIHDMKPGPNSSAFTCVAGTCLVENNRVDNFNYPGSLYNVFAKKAIIRKNNIRNSYCTSVFDMCEYSYFHNDVVVVEDNSVDAVNSVLILGQSEKMTIKNNIFRGLGLYSSSNNRISTKSSGGYKYWYSDQLGVIPTDVETLIDGNICDFTAYDGNRSIAGTYSDYSTGEILSAAKYNNVGANYGCGILIHPNEAKAGSITITNNQFSSIQTLEGVADKNNLAGIFPHAIRLVNTEKLIVRGNTFNGCYNIYGNPNEFSCISVYNYPDVMEKLASRKTVSRKPSEYGKYIIEENVFNIKPNINIFYPIVIFARNNASRQTELKIKNLVVRNNLVSGAVSKTVLAGGVAKASYKPNGLVKIMKEKLR